MLFKKTQQAILKVIKGAWQKSIEILFKNSTFIFGKTTNKVRKNDNNNKY